MVTESLEHAVLAKESSQPQSLYERIQKDKDEDPSTGSDRGLKNSKTSKDAEPTKEEPKFEVPVADMPQDQEKNPNNNDDEPKGKIASK
uniref:Uncharacterized protein n=1 Tax=Tanacetum cinerariifolium TaxID=118510 RepID=A0A699SYG7_TANCI|nr:hypothetical protein [Tanacetum cinerariifolium]